MCSDANTISIMGGKGFENFNFAPVALRFPNSNISRNVSPANQRQGFKQTNNLKGGRNEHQDQPSAKNTKGTDLSTIIPSKTQNTVDYLQWTRRVGGPTQNTHANCKRPRVVWWVAYVDIVLVVLYTAAGIYLVSSTTVFAPEPDVLVFIFFMCTIGISFRLLMALGLLAGLNSDDDGKTLWHCKVWSYCQLALLFVGVFEVIGCVIVYAVHPSTGLQNPCFILAIIFTFVYRLVSFIFVNLFIGKLKRFEGRNQEYAEEQDDIDDDEESRVADEDNFFCIPTTAFLLNM